MVGGALEMKVGDPDGNILWFGMDRLEGVEFGKDATECLGGGK